MLIFDRRVIQEYFHTYEPELLCKRKANRLLRRQFWAAGVNDIWSVDQHDKWLRFGLALHIGIEPFSGVILWLKVWHSNRNSQLILSYYLETVERLGCKYLPSMITLLIPLILTQICPWSRKVIQGQKTLVLLMPRLCSAKRLTRL